MKQWCAPLFVLCLLVMPPAGAEAAGWRLVGWNNLGMHCMDADFSVFAILPPYNVIQAQLIDPQGKLVLDPEAQGITVTFQAVADADGSINSSSIGKTNFWDHVQALFGDIPPDVGLTGISMPGLSNQPQPMVFDTALSWFIAEGIPLTPYDDQGLFNSYPMMRLVARDASSSVLATTDIVLPVSDEMDCSSCHSSSSGPAARPFEGWVSDPDPQRDMRLNILRLHDDREKGKAVFDQALADLGFSADGLFATASGGHAILCASCHSSEALPGSGRPGISPLTQAVHRRMAFVIDPKTGLFMESSDNRSACYRCHPGSVTRCLRGAMGSAVAADGSRAMQCQSCHGTMTAVASTDRIGWLDEPNCQSCHTGTAVSNSGAIRYVSAFGDDGKPRPAADQTFATNPDTPAPGFSLYRFSTGHGGLQCEACHGSTHAEFPSAQRNDNVQSTQLQGHAGMLVECGTCHSPVPTTVDGGPHGMHPLGAPWVQMHPDMVGEGGGAQACRACHGTDYRGTVLSRSQADRVIQTDFGTKTFWRGFQIGCYTCHNGPSSEHGNPNHAPAVMNGATSTVSGIPVDIPLVATDADGDSLELRIVSQAEHGSVGLSGTTARYFPDEGFAGMDHFTFAAWDGATDSNLGSVTVSVSQATPSQTPTATPAPPTATAPPPPTATPVPMASSTLAAPIGAEATEITVADGSGFPDAGVIRIGGELATYSGRSGNTLLGVVRGVESSGAAAHVAGELVELVGFAGDANCDGRRTAADLTALAQRLAAGSAGVCGADINTDGSLSAADLPPLIEAIFSE